MKQDIRKIVNKLYIRKVYNDLVRNNNDLEIPVIKDILDTLFETGSEINSIDLYSYNHLIIMASMGHESREFLTKTEWNSMSDTIYVDIECKWDIPDNKMLYAFQLVNKMCFEETRYVCAISPDKQRFNHFFGIPFDIESQTMQDELYYMTILEGFFTCHYLIEAIEKSHPPA